jgi:hypothetical protein
MGKGIALIVGIKEVDPDQYRGWYGKNGCWGCELDAENIERILEGVGYEIKVLKTREATADNILGSLKEAMNNLTSEDIFVFYYSGHGGQQPDANSTLKDEVDGKDETLVVYDRQIIDDELDPIWLSAPAGARILMISDSCNSGTNYRSMMTCTRSTPFMPIECKKVKSEMKAQMIHFGGCRDGFQSAGYFGGGDFTMALCAAWDNGFFEGNYEELFYWTDDYIESEQKPQYSEYGPVTEEFRNSRPFQISPEARLNLNLNITADHPTTIRDLVDDELVRIVLENLEASVNSKPHPVSEGGTTSARTKWSVAGTLKRVF